MTRTVEEIQEHYKDNGFTVIENAQVYFREFDNPYNDIFTLLDHIAQLEARLQAFGEWESVDEPPPFIRAEQVLSNGEVEWIDIKEGEELPVSIDIDYFSKPLLLQIEAIGCFYGYDGANGEIETRFEIDESTVKGWRYMEGAEHDPTY